MTVGPNGILALELGDDLLGRALEEDGLRLHLLAQLDARKRWLRAQLRDVQKEEKLLRRKVRAAFRDLHGGFKGPIHFSFDGDPGPEPKTIDIEATLV